MSKSAISIIKPLNSSAFAGNLMLHRGIWLMIWRPFIIPHNCESEVDMAMLSTKFDTAAIFEEEPAEAPADWIVSVETPSYTIRGKRTFTRMLPPSEFPSASLNCCKLSRQNTKSASSVYEIRMGLVKLSLKFKAFPSPCSISQTRPRSSASTPGMPMT